MTQRYFPLGNDVNVVNARRCPKMRRYFFAFRSEGSCIAIPWAQCVAAGDTGVSGLKSELQYIRGLLPSCRTEVTRPRLRQRHSVLGSMPRHSHAVERFTSKTSRLQAEHLEVRR